MPDSPRRPLRKRLLLTATALFSSVLIAELAVRVLMPQPTTWLQIYHRHPRLPQYSLEPNASALVETAETKWRIFVDEHGRRWAPTKAKGTPRDASASLGAGSSPVLWLGDSFTFGHGVDYELSWVGLLEADPGAHHAHVNTGVPGYGPTQYRAVLDDELENGLRPAAVVVATFLGNDFQDTIWEKDVPVENGIIGDAGGLKSWFKRTFHVCRLASRVYHQIKEGQPQEVSASDEMADPANWRSGQLAEAEQRYRDEFRRIAARCSERGVPVFGLILASPKMVAKVKEMGMPTTLDVADERAPIVHARKIFDELGIRVIDTTPALAARDAAEVFLPLDGHLTPEGHRIVRGLLQEIPEIN
ncbi:MAG: SGNH/GDSL hydrolase family protein [Planctomycetes bacterium]|nr:SGNH/GDSL hydrolase family protein [Planctomycetota bacterium]